MGSLHILCWHVCLQTASDICNSVHKHVVKQAENTKWWRQEDES